jgi:hypothetical protein
MTNENEFRDYMKAADRTLNKNDDHHLSEAQIVAYYRGEVVGDERQLAQAHLVSCERCIALFRSAADFFDTDRLDEETVSTQDLGDLWSAVWQRSQGTSPVIHEFKQSQSKQGWFKSRVSMALAASLLLSFGALSWATWRIFQERRSRQELRTQVAQLSSKQRELDEELAHAQQGAGDELKKEREQRVAAEAKRDQLQNQLTAAQQNWENVPVYTARLGTERGVDDELHLDFKTDATLVQLLISKPFAYPEFAVEILDQSGQMVREIARLRPTGDAGALSFRVDRAMLKSGKYKLRLLGRQGKDKSLLGEYMLSVK